MPKSRKVHSAFVSTITHRLGWIFKELREGVAAQIQFKRMTAELIVRVWTHLRWIEKRLIHAIARAAAGKPPRPSRPHPHRDPDAETTSAKPCALKLPLPRREGWLSQIMPPVMHTVWVPGAGAHGGSFAMLFAEPEWAPYLNHPSVIRALRPLCRMLGISNLLPPRPARPPREPKPVERTSDLPTATTEATQPPDPPSEHSPPQSAAKSRPVRRIPYHRLRLPMPRCV